MRQDAVERDSWGRDPGFGFVAIALDRSGRDVRGTGGGTAVVGSVGVVAIPLTPFVVLGSAGLFMP